MATNPPEGILDPKVPWSRINPNSRLWLILKARLTGRPQADGYHYSSYVNLSDADADKLIANMKKDPRGYPSLDQESGTPVDWMERQRIYQEWLVEEYLGRKPKQQTQKPDRELDKTKTKSGETKVYKPEDKFVDDVTEELDQKLEEKSNQLMDVVDEFIKQQNQAYEDFKRKQEEERAKKQERVEDPWYSDKTPTLDFGPVSPTPSTSIPDPWEGSATVPPKPTVEQNDDWEDEVPDHIRKRLEDLVNEVQNEPLPQPTETGRRKTRGKKPLGKRKPKFNVKEMGLGESLNEILQNVIETKDALFEMYKVNRERFEFKKKVDAELTQSLAAKLRESQLEQPKEGEDKKSKEKKEMGVIEKSARAGLFAALAGLIGPLVIDLARPFFETSDKETEENPEAPESPSSSPDSGLDEQGSPQPGSPTPDAPQQPPIIPIQQINQTDIKSVTPPQTTPLGLPLKTAATGGKFISGDKEPLRPITKEEVPAPEIKKLTKPITESLNIPKKVSAVSTLSFANAVLSPFASFIPKEGKTFINNMFQEIAQMAGITGLQVRLKDGESIFDMIKKLFGGGGNEDPNGPPGTTGAVDYSNLKEGDISTVAGKTATLYDEFRNLGYTDEAAKRIIAEIGREGSMLNKNMFGTHSDPAAGISNTGLISWNQSRRERLIADAKKAGVWDERKNQFKETAQALRFQARFMANEIPTYSKQLDKMLRSETAKPSKISEMLRDKYIVYRPDYAGGVDPEFGSQRTEEWYNRLTPGLEKTYTPPTNNPPKPPQKPEQKIDRPQTMADKIMDAFRMADAIIPKPFQTPPIPKLDIPGLTNQSSSSQSSRSSAQQPGF